MDFKTFLIIVHLVGLVVGLGGATVADILFMRSLLRNRISREEFKALKLVTDFVVIGLGLLVLSGFALMYANYIAQPESLMNEKVWAKVTIILALGLNGLAMHEYIIPLFEKNLDRRLFRAPDFRKNSLVMFICGGISFVSWYGALVLGTWKMASIYSYGQVTGVYALLVVMVAAGALPLSKIFGFISTKVIHQPARPFEMVSVFYTGIQLARQSVDAETFETLLREFNDAVKKCIREDDIFYFLNSQQVLIALHAPDPQSSQVVLNRLEQAFARFDERLAEFQPEKPVLTLAAA